MSRKNENIEELILKYIDGDLSPKAGREFEDRINRDPQIRELYNDYLELDRLMKTDPEEAPDDRLGLDFKRNIHEVQEKESRRASGFSHSVWMRIAASVTLIAISSLVTMLILDNRSRDDKIAELKQDLQENRALIMKVTEENLSASQRLERIQVSYDMEEPDDDIIGVLINVMNRDDNVNVRIAAIKALAPFTDNPSVRKALVNTLENQEDPFIQIMLINILVKIMEKDAIPEFRKMIEKESIEPSVKDEAQMGLYKLS